ncbi:MAG: hypothetical protein AAF829_04060 [Pseudomonadota bacterium]
MAHSLRPEVKRVNVAFFFRAPLHIQVHAAARIGALDIPGLFTLMPGRLLHPVFFG